MVVKILFFVIFWFMGLYKKWYTSGEFLKRRARQTPVCFYSQMDFFNDFDYKKVLYVQEEEDVSFTQSEAIQSCSAVDSSP